MSDLKISGGAATSRYRHSLVEAMNSFMAPFFPRPEDGRRGRFRSVPFSWLLMRPALSWTGLRPLARSSMRRSLEDAVSVAPIRGSSRR